MLEPDEPPPELTIEALVVRKNRFDEACKAGLSEEDAGAFADSNADVGWLRKLVAGHCDPETIARILL